MKTDASKYFLFETNPFLLPIRFPIENISARISDVLHVSFNLTVIKTIQLCRYVNNNNNSNVRKVPGNYQFCIQLE